MTWREYHEATKHSVDSLRGSPHSLDWANMPDPFRHYEGVPVLDLPADPPAPGIPVVDGAGFLSQLLFYSAAISGSKRVPSTRAKYALRVNPSSGNLHPTEFHFRTRGLQDWPDGQYHYRVSSHMAEQRALGDFGTSAPIVFLLTSIAWREAWKYRDRAYRYCLHDVGHAWQSLELAARAMGCEVFATGQFSDDDIGRAWRLSPDEWPMMVVEVHPPHATTVTWFGGEANRLSDETIEHPLIEEIHAVTKQLAPVAPVLPVGAVARQRRSALDFVGGDRSMSRAQLSAILAAATTQFVQLYVYVHRVEGMEPGVYRGWEQVRSGDQRVVAAGLSLGQDLAGNACVAFSMVADLDRATNGFGDRGYRYAHFEAGAIGQCLYLAAEAHGLQATGIGAFYDDDVNRYLELEPGRQVIYHFAIGYAVPDPRLKA